VLFTGALGFLNRFEKSEFETFPPATSRSRPAHINLSAVINVTGTPYALTDEILEIAKPLT
jgi:hypothetical protein